MIRNYSNQQQDYRGERADDVVIPSSSHSYHSDCCKELAAETEGFAKSLKFENKFKF